MLDSATMNAMVHMDETIREPGAERFGDFDAELGPRLLREFIAELVARWRKADRLLAPVAEADIDRLAAQFKKDFAPILSAGAGQEDVNRLIQQIAKELAAEKKVKLSPDLLTAKYGPLYEDVPDRIESPWALDAPPCLPRCGTSLKNSATGIRRDEVRRIHRDIFDQAVAAYDRYAIEELHKMAEEKGLWAEASFPSPSGSGPGTLVPSPSGRGDQLELCPEGRGDQLEPAPEGKGDQLAGPRAELDAAWSPHLFLWKKSKDDLLKEMDSVVRMPGWANIWTQPIINRIDMLATGVRTMIGVKVFGSDLDKIQEVSEQVADVLRQVPGAVDVVSDQSRDKGYLEIRIDRDRAARYGVRVGDVQDVIETALGGKEITMTVEGRERFPVRIRYARTFREDEEDMKNLLVNAATIPMGQASGGMNGGAIAIAGSKPAPGAPRAPLQIPLAMVADVKIVQGPAVIESENGMLRYKVQLNVRDRDLVGFVEEAQRVVAQKIKLPQGTYLAWSGQFENQVRAGRRCRSCSRPSRW